MTQQQRNDLDRALVRAAQRGIAIVGHGTRKRDGATVFLVSSGSQTGENHWVIVSAGRLICDCPSRVLCVHRAVVHARLATIAAHQAETARATALARAASLAQRRETAPLAHGDKPFSLWK